MSRTKRPWVAGGITVVIALAACTPQEDASAAPSSAVPSSAVPVSAVPGDAVSGDVFSDGAVAAPDTSLQFAAAPEFQSGSSFEAALAQLNSLAIKGRAPKTGYDRDLFGQAWTDDVDVAGGHNGCDTRNDILQRDLVDIVFKPGSNNCAVQSGTLHDPYTGSTIAFTRGKSTSSAVQIDHVVALSDAWQKGAQQLDTRTRWNFANDPRNLRAVDGPANQQKSDGDAATWLPPNKAYRCDYVAAQVEVKAAYDLWVTQAEHDAFERVLTNCSGAPAPAPAPAPTTEPEVVPSPAPAPIVEPAPVVEEAPSGPFANCAAARAAGAAPVYAGTPGYSPKLDRDGDGVGCE